MLFKTIVILGAFLAVAHAELSPEFKEKLMSKVQEVGAACAQKEKASGEDIGELLAQKVPTSKEGKCLIACFNQEFGFQDATGKFAKEASEKALEPIKKEDEALYNKMIDIGAQCLPEVKSSDRCDAAAEMAGCFNAKAKASGIDPEVFM